MRRVAPWCDSAITLSVHRLIAILILLAGITVTTWLRSERVLIVPNKTLRFIALDLSPPDKLAAHLGPFKLSAAWHMTWGNFKFGGYSGLMALPDGRFLALADNGHFLAFSPPGGPKTKAILGQLLKDPRDDKRNVDTESVTRDPKTGNFWSGLEFSNAIVRFGPDWKESGRVQPELMADWAKNSGAESLVRLNDGRFIVVSEGTREWIGPNTHHGVVFEDDPIETGGKGQPFIFEGLTGFKPVDMAQMPDGRVLVLMRALIWPIPQHFAGRLAIADPAQIREGGTWKVTEVARIASDLSGDNFEAMAIVPRDDGKLVVWLLSDDNQSPLQRTLLWKLVVDPADLPHPIAH